MGCLSMHTLSLFWVEQMNTVWQASLSRLSRSSSGVTYMCFGGSTHRDRRVSYVCDNVLTEKSDAVVVLKFCQEVLGQRL
ncbi:hypothetical protein EJ03DRAFT_53760 [Teratosphaeria nubilosa]|uniref:Uncharacterized protein n=1 Tax=Teratosphaeria nubilosa TaxID=161662 RepID=A0A6G1KUF8_9PEZI|nr:hypothetical protein EJ03DRAFT_53760 [Teratosphaeria nubilosa]